MYVKGPRISRFDVQLFVRFIDRCGSCFGAPVWRIFVGDEEEASLRRAGWAKPQIPNDISVRGPIFQAKVATGDYDPSE